MYDLHLKSAYVEITSKCNLFCEHCYNNSLNSNTEEISLETLERIYIDFAEHAISNISLSGGEPFLHTGISRVLEFSQQYAVDTQFVTNGVVLDKYMSIIQNNPYLNFQVSIDGVGESHNKIRGAQIFDKVDRNIELLKQCGKYIIFKSTINKMNMGEYERIVRYAVSKRIPKLSFSLLNLQGRAAGNERITLTPEEEKKAVEVIGQLSTNSKGIIEITPPKISNSVCPFINNENADISPRIDSSGHVFLCSMFVNPMYSLGNANRDNISSITKNTRTKNILDFLNAFFKINECEDCYMHSMCSKGCPAQYLNDLPDYRVDSCSFKRTNYLQSVFENLTTSFCEKQIMNQ